MDDFKFIRVKIDEGVATAVIDNPPINLLTIPLFLELARLASAIEADERVRVLVLKSANPDFFIAHFDVEAILGFPTAAPPALESKLNGFHEMCERLRTMGKATIAQIEGRVGGGGSELVSSMDMRFGVRGRTVINQMEVALGILPGGSGTQRLPHLVGRGCALEIILGSDDLDAETAERWGYLNRVFAPHEIGPFVDRLARRIASFPAPAIALAKRAVMQAESDPKGGLLAEAQLFQSLLRTGEAQTRLRAFLAQGGQTPAGEKDVSALVMRVARGE